MARGSTAKLNITNRLEAAFGKDFIGEFDKKVYLWADDGGERVQIAISMTCPKNEIDIKSNNSAEDESGWDWSDPTPVSNDEANNSSQEISQEEIDRVADLMEKFGL